MYQEGRLMKPRSIPLVDVEEDGLPFESAEQFKTVWSVGGEIERSVSVRVRFADLPG